MKCIIVIALLAAALCGLQCAAMPFSGDWGKRHGGENDHWFGVYGVSKRNWPVKNDDGYRYVSLRAECD